MNISENFGSVMKGGQHRFLGNRGDQADGQSSLLGSGYRIARCRLAESWTACLTQKARHCCRAFLTVVPERLDLEIHAAHAALSAAARRHAATAGVLLRHFGNHGFGGDQKRSNRRCVLDRHEVTCC
jgi:hypothetical protein